jgi:hypothetical protein
MGDDDFLAFYISLIICIDGLFDHLCDIGAESAEENGRKCLYIFIMIFSVIYNAALAIYGSNLKAKAVLAWHEDVGTDYDDALNASTDTDKMFEDTPDGDANADGTYC